MMDRVQRQYSEGVLNTCVISFNLLFSTYVCHRWKFADLCYLNFLSIIAFCISSHLFAQLASLGLFTFMP